jgi:GDP-L-fucose synthase
MQKNDTVLITGASGMSGSSIKQKLLDLRYTNLLTPGREELDYTRKFCVQEYFDEHKPDILVVMLVIMLWHRVTC